jgi:formamidopyrimidine-DNA glycosylase
MPEIAEVETIRKGIKSYLRGKKIINLKFSDLPLRTNLSRDEKLYLVNKSIVSLVRRGKYLLLYLECGRLLMIHLGMTGVLLLNPTNTRPFDHMEIYLSNGSVIVFRDVRRFGMLSMYDSVIDFENEKKLGLECLSNSLTGKYIHTLLRNRRCSIKNFLMNQRFIAGLGNIYVNEVLFKSRISPFHICNNINMITCHILVKYIKLTIKKALLLGGTTLKDYVNHVGELGKFQNYFNIYSKEGLSCIKCGLKIKKYLQSGRSSFYCSSCQE